MFRHKQIRMLVALAIMGNGAFFIAPASRAVAGDNLQGTDILGPAVKNLLKPSPGSPVMPEDSTTALIDSLEGFSAAMGIPQDATEEVLAAGLEADVAGRLAALVDALHACHRKTQKMVGGMSPKDFEQALREFGKGHIFEPFQVKNMRDCAAGLQDIALEATSFLTSTATTASLELWPVLAVNRALTNDVYVHDYALIIDTAGNDTYANNIGGNLLDVTRGPLGSAASQQVPADGCENIPDAAAGECVISAAVLIDTAGDDIYGRTETPGDDAKCTSDLLVRRIVTHGSGLAGVGILIDSQGNDIYTAKTVSQGSGHVGGVGIQRDLGSGDDTYIAIRNAQGFALVSGVGILDDEGGSDVFDYYMPAGGVIDDTGACDDLPRMLQGTALLEGVGIFINWIGADDYRAAPPKVQNFASGIQFGHSSQGFGGFGGVGFFFDLSGEDTYSYEADASDGPPRWDEHVILSGQEIVDDDKRFVSTGQFIDVNSAS